MTSSSCDENSPPPKKRTKLIHVVEDEMGRSTRLKGCKSDHYRCTDCGYSGDYEAVLALVDIGKMEEKIKRMRRPHFAFEKNQMSVVLKELVDCQRCGEPIALKIRVDILFKWKDDWENQKIKDVRLNGYHIVSPDTEERTLLEQVEEEDLNYNELEKCTVKDAVKDAKISKAELDIVAVTYMKGGNCIMAISKTKKFLRPIYDTREDSCCWPSYSGINIFCRYLFRVCRFPDPETDLETAYPHRNEDTIVVNEIPQFVRPRKRSKIYNALRSVSKIRVNDIFTSIWDFKYVHVNTMCPSVGVLRCSQNRLDLFYNSFGKLRLSIRVINQYDFPVTGLNVDKDSDNADDEALVILGLGRPFSGPDGNYFPPRCYILALNILFKSNFSD